jgi:hypothetical protein
VSHDSLRCVVSRIQPGALYFGRDSEINVVFRFRRVVVIDNII